MGSWTMATIGLQVRSFFCLFNINDLKLHFVVFEKVAAFLSTQNNGRKFE
jgi:hypothetical protein